MRIAQIAPLAQAVLAKMHGGTKRVVSCLSEELVRLVHLFASGDSVAAANLSPKRVSSHKRRKSGKL